MKKYLFFFVIIILFFGLANQKASAATLCRANFNVAIRDPYGATVKNAQFYIYQEGLDANGMRQPVKQVGSARVDSVLGYGKVQFNVATTSANYVIRVVNPSLKNRDFLFYDKISAQCGSTGAVDLTLSTFRITATDMLSNNVKNVAVIVSVQGTDATNKIVNKEVLGTFNTGPLGMVDVFAPATERLSNQGFNFYLISVRNAKGLIFEQQNVTANDSYVKYIDIRLSDAVITIKDRNTSKVVPNFKIMVYSVASSVYGGFNTGKLINTITTDDQGRAYIQLPVGFYYLTYADSNGQNINTPIEIKAGQRQEITNWLENYRATSCKYKSDLKLIFKDFAGKTVGNIAYTLFLQKNEPEGWPVASAKVVSGNVDEFGLSSIKFTTTPAQKYILQACPQKTKTGCFWFANIDFACSEKLILEKTIPAVTFVLRDTESKLLVGQKFKVYQQTKDVDGKVIVDKDLLLGQFTLNAPGNITLFLPSKDLRGWDQNYIIVIEQKNRQIARANFSVTDKNLTLDYIVDIGRMALKNKAPVKSTTTELVVKSADNKLRGRILLQVEARGEAWYIHPVTGGRYYLGGPSEAFGLMRKLSFGASNKDLAKIEPVLTDVTGTDTDGDGLPDRLEQAFSTDINKIDSDGDGYDDPEELSKGFNPVGNGNIGYSSAFAKKQAGKILLQVEGKGEAWYVSPVNNKRYYLGAPADAYQLMRKLGLGATNASLDKISVAQ